LVNDQAVLVLFEERTRGLAGMVLGTVLDQDDGAGDLGQ